MHADYRVRTSPGNVPFNLFARRPLGSA